MVLAFGDLTFDAASGELRLGEAPVDIQPKAVALLQYLIERRDRVVRKQELLDALWPGEVVSEGVLKRAIHALRVAVGDSASKQSVIATRSRVGYRFVAPLRDAERYPTRVAGADEEPEPGRSDFVGRALSLGQLRGAWARARAGCGAVVLVAGQPGIGKTRLVEELSLQVVREGGKVLTGWCDESRGAPPYWPWLQIVRALGGDGEEAVDQLGAVDADRRFDSPSVEIHEHADRSIFARQHVISRSLIRLAGRRPLVVVLEDLHWADRATLGAFAFAAREISSASILLVGTFRDDELPPDHPLVSDIRRLTPRASDLRIHLEGLSCDEVRALLAELADREPHAAALGVIHARTAGNPLFVREIARALLENGSIEDAAESTDGIDEVPLGVVGVLEQRMARLSSDSRALLEIAAVIGTVFDRSLLKALEGGSLESIADALDSARRAGIVRASREDPAEWEFAHALLRDVLLHTMRPSRRLRLHRDLLAELEARHLPDPQSALARLADHANAIYRAGGDAHRALAYDRLAAWHAAARYAYHDCSRHAERALATLASLEARGYADPVLATELRIDRARAAHMQRNPALALENAEEAARLAQARGDPIALARAAMSLFVHPPAGLDLVRRNVRLLEVAEESVERGSAIWIQLVSARVEQLSLFPASGARRARDSAEALEHARAVGDRKALVRALSADLLSNWSRHSPDVRLACSRELHDRVAGTPDRFGDVFPLLTALVEQGDLVAWEKLIRGMRRRIEAASADKYYAYFDPLYSATRALWGGRLDHAERLMKKALESMEIAGPLWGERAFSTQLLQLRIDQGRSAELEAAVRLLHTQFPNDRSIPAVLSYVLCEQDRIEEARPIFEAAADEYRVASDINATVTLTVMASVAAALRDARRAEHLYSMLEPLREVIVVNLGCWICQGSAHWPLGLLAWTMGEGDRAECHLERAVSRNRELGIRTYEARAGIDLAALLAERSQPEGLVRARDHLEAALVIAHRVGMARVAARGEALKSSLYW